MYHILKKNKLVFWTDILTNSKLWRENVFVCFVFVIGQYFLFSTMEVWEQYLELAWFDGPGSIYSEDKARFVSENIGGLQSRKKLWLLRL